ncbi:MAG TPA: exodeoxyribonuclease VII small subunit [Aggregatilineales bacterium]|nr:exodeoxyribonuclease VII small subunit [Aggregatilineales bacterium]
MSESPTIRFEDAYRELESIIDRLEAGNLSLDESMSLFERGRELATICEQHLNAAELKVSQLLGEDDSDPRTELLE